MKIDVRLQEASTLASIQSQAKSAEQIGYDTLWSQTKTRDPFLPLAVAASETTALNLGTSIPLAFAHYPMTLAYVANDLQQYSAGRFTLGLGSQVKAHIERRFSMPWSQPAERMAELISTIRQIWASWQSGASLKIEGRFYRHTLMPPAFVPEPNPFGAPRIALAAVGERMTEVAARHADSLHVHPFTSRTYLSETTLPTIARGREESLHPGAKFELSVPVMVATGVTKEEVEVASAATRRQIAFYASTPAYSSVLAVHGWEEIGRKLHELSTSGSPTRWDTMTDLIDDEMLNTFAAVGPADTIAGIIRQRVKGLADRISLYLTEATDPATLNCVVADLRTLEGSGTRKRNAIAEARHQQKKNRNNNE